MSELGLGSVADLTR